MKQFKVRLENLGQDVIVRIPPALLEALGTPVGQSITLTGQSGSIQLQPVAPRYTLGELLGKCDPSMPLSEEERAWVDARPIGREMI